LLISSSNTVVPALGGSPAQLGRFTAFAWTPDSTRLLATLTNAPTGVDLWSIAADGSDPQPIAQNAYGAVLSSDGQRLVFDRLGEVVVTDLAGQVLHDLGRWDAGLIDLHMQFAPQWSPDGTKILFWSGGKIMLADAGSGEVRALTGGPGEQIGQPVWAADGSAVYATISDTAGNTDVYVSRADGSHLRPVFTDPVPEGGPVWSPDGKQIAFVRYGSPPSLIVTDTVGHARVLVRSRTLASGLPLPDDGSAWPGSPAWSPNGETIAVPSSAGILLVDVRTGKVSHWSQIRSFVPPVWSTRGTVAWSRDGAIAYADGQEDSYVWVVKQTSTWKVRTGLFDEPPDYCCNAAYGIATNLSWSPDASKLAFTRWGEDAGTGWYANFLDSIRIVDRRTHRAHSVPTDSWSFAWSPDGRYLIEGGFNAVITRTDGRRVATLKDLRALHPSWQPLCQHRAALSH
jgi:Tol biopolymer transport system component